MLFEELFFLSLMNQVEAQLQQKSGPHRHSFIAVVHLSMFITLLQLTSLLQPSQHSQLQSSVIKMEYLRFCIKAKIKISTLLLKHQIKTKT